MQRCCWGLTARQRNSSGVPEAAAGRTGHRGEFYGRKMRREAVGLLLFRGERASVLKRNIPLLKREHLIPFVI